MSTKKVIIGVLSGTLAGLAVGLLYAPAKGEDTRQKIVDSADELKNKIADTADEWKTKLTETADEWKAKFKRLKGQAVDELDELQSIFENEASGLSDDVKERVMNLIASSKKSFSDYKDTAKNTASAN